MSSGRNLRPSHYLFPIAAWITLLAQNTLLAQTLFQELTKPPEGRSMRASSTFRKGADGKYDPKADPLEDDTEWSNEDCFLVPPGETKVVLDADGPGVITHLWFTFFPPEKHEWAPEGSASNLDMLLRIFWDNRRKPAVEAPMGDFFCNAFGKRYEVASLPVAVGDSGSYNCYWNMPFRKAARIEVVNQGEKPISLLYYNIDWIKTDSLPDDTPYFHARYRQEYPLEHGKDYVILETKGRGRYVGTLLSVRTRSPNWFGEGDEKIFLDGERKASIYGTGTEDYFLQAWGLKKTTAPFFGTPFYDQPYRLIGSKISCYRWHMADPIAFEKGIKVAFEHYGWTSIDENPDYKQINWNEREDDFSSVAYWYQLGEPTFDPPMPSAKERHLPSIERAIVYAKDFADAKHHGQGLTAVQEMPKLYDQPQLRFEPRVPEEGWLEIPIEVKRKEPLRLIVNATCAPDVGKYQASLDGVKLGEPLDFYSPEIVNKEFPLMDFWPEPGTYTLRLECVGKYKLSDGANAAIESILLRERRPRVEKYGHDKDKDWRKQPMLYRG